MASLPGFRFDITGASGSQNLLSPKQSWRVYILPRGGYASQDSTGAVVTFDSASVASRFAVNNWVQVGTATSKIRQVAGVGGNSISLNTAVTVTENDRILLIGNTEPTVSGGSATYTTPNTIVRQRDDDAADLYTNSMITTNANGLVQGFAATNLYDALIQDGNQSNQGWIADLPVGVPEGISVSDAAFFGSTVTISGLSVTGWAHFGSTVTMHAALGVTGAVVLGATLTVSGGFSGTAVIPRLGQRSTATTGGALRIVEGNVFPLTVAGVQAALDECDAAGGGTVFMPSGAGITITTTSVKIPNRVKLIGTGDHTSTATFVGAAGTSAIAMVQNKAVDGTQQYAYIDGIYINGNKASGAVVDAGLNFTAVYVGTRIKDVLITNCAGNGLVIGGSGASIGAGQLVWDNITVTGCNDDNILVTGPVDSVYGLQTTSESAAAGKAMMKIANATATASRGHAFFGVHMEGTSACDGVVIDGCCNVHMDNVVWDGGASQLNVIKIMGSTGGSDGSFASGGHLFTNVSGNLTTIIDDRVAGVSISNADGRFVRFYASPIASATLDVSQMIGVQSARRGVAIASAATIAPADGNFFEITGTTDVQNITPNLRYAGKAITLMWSNSSPGDLGTGGNVRLAGGATFSPAQWDAITLACNGTTWFEASPR